MSKRPGSLLAFAALAFLVAALASTAYLWPQTGDDEITTGSAGHALIAGGVLAVGAAVCWTGSVLADRLGAIWARLGDRSANS